MSKFERIYFFGLMFYRVGLRGFLSSSGGEQLCLWTRPCQTLTSPKNFSLKNLKKLKIEKFLKISKFERIYFFGLPFYRVGP